MNLETENGKVSRKQKKSSKPVFKNFSRLRISNSNASNGKLSSTAERSLEPEGKQSGKQNEKKKDRDFQRFLARTLVCVCGSMARMVPKGSRSELVDRFSIPSEKCRIRLLKHMMKPSLLLMRGGVS